METNEKFDALVDDSGPCLSILMPVDRSESRARTAGVRLRSLLRETEQRALAGKLSAAETAGLLAPWETAVADPKFWKAPGDGVALFSSPRQSAVVWLDEPVREGIRVASSFALLALLRLRARRPFYLLAVSRKACRLIRWDGEAVHVVKVEAMPESVEAAVGTAQPRELQFHSTGRPRRRNVHAGGSGGDETAELRTYLQRVDAALHERLSFDTRVPLVLAGVESLIGLYRSISHLPNLLAEGLTGNFDRSSGRILSALARPLVERALNGALERELARFAELAGSGLAVSDARAVRAAASTGGVETLFLPDPGEVAVLSDAAESMAIDVLRRGGEVYMVPSWRMPGAQEGVEEAGILRHGHAAETRADRGVVRANGNGAVIG